MGLESRSGQGFSRGAVATAITASGIVTEIVGIAINVFNSCNSDYCERYCDNVKFLILIFIFCCNSDYCERYCDRES